ncbi:Polygalacturonate 4-alpha-galacturonosyltransferase [Platanthera guangdongensis]|uniref:Polygalacturonate 4-alpha-galacturonosyltransferase n=1 Tax=Platanthera guangdongensis TaxID=2320717 RepID=A0ABR2M7V9_9ASPA
MQNPVLHQIKKNDRPNKKEAKTTNSMNHEKEIIEKQNVNPTGSDVRVRRLKDQLIQARVAYEKLKALEQILAKGKQIQDDCSAIVKKLRALLLSTEELLRAHRKQAMFLSQLAAKTLPKGLHCLPLRLSTEYYSLDASQQMFHNKEKLEDPNLFHYALFSDNILAAVVVVNSTVFHAKKSQRKVRQTKARAYDVDKLDFQSYISEH